MRIPKVGKEFRAESSSGFSVISTGFMVRSKKFQTFRSLFLQK
jgi:hypothetical protein